MYGVSIFKANVNYRNSINISHISNSLLRHFTKKDTMGASELSFPEVSLVHTTRCQSSMLHH